MKNVLLILIAVLSVSCVSTKSTLKNVDDNAPDLKVTKENAFVVTEVSTDPKYGYDPDYPINIFYRNTKDEDLNPQRFFNALTGPNGEKIFYKKVDTCCPFPSKRTEMGAGVLDMYEIRWVGIKRTLLIYVNIYAKGKVMAPMGLALKK